MQKKSSGPMPMPAAVFLLLGTVVVSLFMVAVWIGDERWAQTGFIMIFPAIGAGLW